MRYVMLSSICLMFLSACATTQNVVKQEPNPVAIKISNTKSGIESDYNNFLNKAMVIMYGKDKPNRQ